MFVRAEQMDKDKVFAAIIAIIFIFLLSCSKDSDNNSEIFRIIDHLEKNNIVRTPLSNDYGSEQSKKKSYPLKSSLLLDAGAGENPFAIKRKLRLGGTERNIVFSPPDSEYRITCELRGNSILEFGIGIIRDKHSEKEQTSQDENSNGVNFVITLEINGRKKTVFQKYISGPSGDQEGSFSFIRYSVKLPYEQKKAYLIFETTGSSQNYSFWVNPVLYSKKADTRNVILISIDTLRADHLGCYGYDRETSPNIDALAADSSVFLNTYASSSWTLPSHISLLTSLHSIHHQVSHEDDRIDPEIITLADMMRINSFSCAAFTGGGFVSSSYGFSKGFDSYNEGVGGVFHQDSAERVYGAVSDWIDRQQDRDFFLFIHTYQTHNPYVCPYPYKVMFLDEKAKVGNIDLKGHLGGLSNIFKKIPEPEVRNIIGLYDGEIRYTDEKLIGQLVNKLKQLGLYQQTMIIVTSDHGEEFFDHGGWEHGHTLYDELIKVPLIIKFPDLKYKGQRSKSIVSLVDLMPTICDEMGVDSSGLKIDGKSLIPVLRGREKKDRVFLAELGGNILNSHIPEKISTNRGKKKLILSQRFSPAELDFFTFPPPEAGPVEFYDLSVDPFEKNNTAGKNIELVNRIIDWIDEIIRTAEKRMTGKAVMNEKLREQLKELGYIR
jgi:arylsulfatase A-like enzyme